MLDKCVLPFRQKREKYDIIFASTKMEGRAMSAKKETKREKFVRMAEARTIKIISMVRLLGNCSNRLAYEYSDKDVNKIFSAIESAVSDAKKRFKSSPSGNAQVFSLS